MRMAVPGGACENCGWPMRGFVEWFVPVTINPRSYGIFFTQRNGLITLVASVKLSMIQVFAVNYSGVQSICGSEDGTIPVGNPKLDRILDAFDYQSLIHCHYRKRLKTIEELKSDFKKCKKGQSESADENR
jgi:hypothetical protein